MKKLLQLILLLMLSILIHYGAKAQSTPFSSKQKLADADAFYDFNLTLSTKLSDVTKKGTTYIFDGKPSDADVRKALFSNETGNRFFSTYVSPEKIPLELSVTLDPKPQIANFPFFSSSFVDYFDNVVVSVGDYADFRPRENLKKFTYNLELSWYNWKFEIPFYSYLLDRRASEPNTKTNHARLVIYELYKGGKIFKTLIFPVVVIGSSFERIGIGSGPFELVSILRPPPGDQSYTSYLAGQEVLREVSNSLTEGNSQSSTEKIEANVGLSLGPVDLGGSYSEETTKTHSKVVGKTNTYLVKTNMEREYKNAGKTDMYIYQQDSVQFILQTTVNVATSNKPDLQIFKQQEILLWPIKRKFQQPVTEQTLLANEKTPGSLKFLRARNRRPEANFWESVMAMNKRIKTKATGGEPVSAPTTTTFTTSNTKTESYTQELSFSASRTVAYSAKAGASFGGLSVGAEYSNSNTVTMSTAVGKGTLNGATSYKTVKWEMADGNLGKPDAIKATMKEDAVFGTPIFEINAAESITSCPYEGGIRVDDPGITVKDPVSLKEVKTAKYSDLTSDKKALFEFILKNKSADYNREFKFKIVGNDLPPIEFLSGITGANNMISIPKNGNITARIRASNPDPESPIYKNYGFKDIYVILESLCDQSSSDTITLGVFYGDSDENRAPDNSLIQQAVLLPSDGSLQTKYINKFEKSVNITNKNAKSSPTLKALLPATDCFTGWCAENTGKPEITNAVWFKFVVTTPEVQVSTCYDMNASFDSQMAIFKIGDRNNLATYTRLGANDNKACVGNSSKMTLQNLTLGDTLYVLVDGFQGAQSDFGISVEAKGPGNDVNCNSITLKVNGVATTGYSNYAATAELNEKFLIPASQDPIKGWKDDQIQHSVWFDFSAPEGGEVIIDVQNATFDAQVAVFRQGRVCEPDFFSQFTHIGANDDVTLAGGLDSRLYIKGLVSGNRYGILVDGYQGAMGYFDMKLSIPIPTNDEPCNAITLETDATGQGVFSNGGATASTAEQAIAPPTVEINKPGGWSDKADDSRARRIEKSVWFKFKAPSGGAVQISTCNQASFIAQMAVYRTTNCNDFSKFKLIGADDNSQLCRLPPSNEYPNGTNKRGSIVNLTGLEGDSTYYILIDGSLNDFGQFSIDILTAPSSPPVNDLACKAIALPTNGVVQKDYTNMGATASATEYKIVPPQFKDRSMLGTVWFTFVAPVSGIAEISTCNLANFDTQLAVYTVPDCKVDTNFVLIGANEDGPSSCATNGDSFLQLKGLTAGKTYYIVVDGYGNNKGNFSIVIRDQITPGPVNDNVDKAISIAVDGQVKKGFTNSFATVQDKEQNIRPKSAPNQDCTTGWCDNQVDDSVWFKFVAPADGKVFVSTCDLAIFDTQLAVYSATNVNDFSTFTLIAANDAGPVDCSTDFDSYLPVTGLKAGQIYYVMVDGFNGASGSFDISITGAADTQAPSIPTNLAATDTQTTSIAISWNAASDNTGVKEYLIYVDGALVGTTADTKYTISGLKASTAYSITVVAKDAAGNASTASTAVKVTTSPAPDTQAPTAPTNLAATDTKTTSIAISWTASTDNVGVKEYRVYLDAALKGTTTQTSFTLSDLTAATAYSIYVVAVDAAGNTSNPSTALKVTTSAAADTQAPSAPTNLAATETNATDVKVSWTASTDNVGVKEYRVFVDNVQTKISTTTSATVTGLAPQTAYSLHVVAADAAGNVSGSSNTLKVTTAAQQTVLLAVQHPFDSQISVSPNPFVNHINLKFPENFDFVGNIEVRDLVGRLIAHSNLEEASNGLIRIDMTAQSAGMFILIINQEVGIIHRKILKY